jgi:hypothetical protein
VEHRDGTVVCPHCGTILNAPANAAVTLVIFARSGRPAVQRMIADGVEIHWCTITEPTTAHRERLLSEQPVVVHPSPVQIPAASAATARDTKTTKRSKGAVLSADRAVREPRRRTLPL